MPQNSLISTAEYISVPHDLQNLHHCAELLFVRGKFIFMQNSLIYIAEYIKFYRRISKMLPWNSCGE